MSSPTVGSAVSKVVTTLAPIILNELKNCRFHMYKDEQDKPHIVLGYKKDELLNYEKDFCIDYEKIIGYLSEKITRIQEKFAGKGQEQSSEIALPPEKVNESALEI